MLLTSSLAVLLSTGICMAVSPSSILGTEDSACKNATGVVQDPSCWAALGYNAWFDTWEGLCTGAPRCGCSGSKPWSDCALRQYQNAIDSSTKTTISCVDLKQPDLCQIPNGNWTKFSDNQLATAYAATAIGNLYHFVYDWYIAITNSTAPAAVLSTLSYQIEHAFGDGINRTTVDIATFLTTLMTNYDTNKAVVQSFTNVMSKVLGKTAMVDLTKTDVKTFQYLLGQALGETLNATLSAWNTPYFDTISRNGVLLSNPLRNGSQLNDSLARAPPFTPFDTVRSLGSLSNSSTSRALLSADIALHRNFFMQECGAGSPGGLVEQLAALLDEFHYNLFRVMKETTKGARSRLGFTQLFKTAKWIPIRRLYEQMYNAVGTRGNTATDQTIANNPPRFICLEPHNEDTRTAYSICKAEPRLRAVQQPGQPNAIGLCPAFWALPRAPVRAFCPYKGEVNDEYTGNALQLNQQSVLVHQLIRIYLGKTVLNPESYTLNEALKLDENDAYLNPSTWSYWYASVIGCTPQSWSDPEL